MKNKEKHDPMRRLAVDALLMAELRDLKRRAGVAEETVRIKKERLDEAEQRRDEAEQEYEEEHRTFTVFSKQLEEKWEQRFDALARLGRDAGVRVEDIQAARKQPWKGGDAAEQATAEQAEQGEL